MKNDRNIDWYNTNTHVYSYVLVDINTCTDCENVFVNIHEQKTFEDDTQWKRIKTKYYIAKENKMDTLLLPEKDPEWKE